MKNSRYLVIFFVLFFVNSCDQSRIDNSKIIDIDPNNRYKNIGFALIYNDSLKNIRKLDSRSLNIYHKNLKKKSLVKITNPENGNSLIAEVKSNRENFSDFYNSILSSRIAEILELNQDEPYVEIVLISKNSTFVAKKAKTFDEERSVAQKAPIDGIQINDLNAKKKEKGKIKDKIFSYSIKVADFYYKDTAKTMIKRIKVETTVKKIKVIKLSLTKYRVLIGPFNDIKSLKESFEKIKMLNFENLEILRNV